MSSGKRRDKHAHQNKDRVVEEEKDFNSPTLVDTVHMGGEIAKVTVATTHLAVMTSLGLVYTWGIGKSGQLVRPDDDSKTLELIECEDKMVVASDILCAGDCTFVMERDTGRIFGCGFNSSGQLGKLETDDEQSIMTIRTKKRVVKVRQPANIHFQLKEIHGLPKQLSWEGEATVLSNHKISPPTNTVGQELLEWCLKAFRHTYDANVVIKLCVEAKNFEAASLLESMGDNPLGVLRHKLSGASTDRDKIGNAVHDYLETVVTTQSASVEQVCQFLMIVVGHCANYAVPASVLEDILDLQRCNPPWDVHINCAMKEIIASSDDSAEWMANNMSPLFILNAIRSSNENAAIQISNKSIEENDHTENGNVVESESIDFNQSNDSDIVNVTNGVFKPVEEVHSSNN